MVLDIKVKIELHLILNSIVIIKQKDVHFIVENELVVSNVRIIKILFYLEDNGI